MNRALFILASLTLLAGCGKPQPAEQVGIPQRIISLSPAITETVYALGLGDKLVGATTYCTYPEAAKNVPRVGGYGQYNFEAIISLKPDLVILHHTFESEKARLDGLGIPYLETRAEHMADIIDSIRTVGAACGAGEKADELLAKIDAQTKRLHAPRKEPRVLVVFGGNAGTLETIHAFGADCLHNDLLDRAGGVNVIKNKLAFSTLSKEAVIRLNPEIIIQLAPGTEAPADPVAAWGELPGVDAVKNRRVYVLTGDYTCIPGPRFTQILDDFSGIIRQNDLEAE